MGINFFRGGCGAVKGSSSATMSCRRGQCGGLGSMIADIIFLGDGERVISVIV